MKTYDLSKYPAHHEENKPYSVIFPDSEQADRELSALFNVPEHVNALAKQLAKKRTQNAILRTAKAISVGLSPSGEGIYLVLQAAYSQGQLNGGYFIVLCDELGVAELHQDLNDFEREARDEIQGMISRAEEEEKKRRS